MRISSLQAHAKKKKWIPCVARNHNFVIEVSSFYFFLPFDMISMESSCTFTFDKWFIFKRSIILAFRQVKNHSDRLQDHTTEGQLVHCLFMTSLGNIISFESSQVTYEKCLCYVWRFAVNMCETGIQVLGIAWLYASAFIVVPCDCILWDKGSDLLDTILAGSISLESFVGYSFARHSCFCYYCKH